MPGNPNGQTGWTAPGDQRIPPGYYQESARADGTNVGLFSHSSLNPNPMPGPAPMQQPPVQGAVNAQRVPAAGQEAPEMSGADFSQTLTEKTGHIVQQLSQPPAEQTQQPPADQAQQMQQPEAAEQQGSITMGSGENEQQR